jgi:outer membrane protein TolC
VRKNHPAVALAEARVQARQAALVVERRVRIPAFAFEAFTDRELDKSVYGIGLQVDLPLWSWNSGPIAAAEAALVAEREQARSALLELETAAIAAASACRAGIELSTRYRERILKGVQNAAKTIERTYTLGEASLLELIEVRRTLLETETQYLGALAQAQSDCSLEETLAGDTP